MTDDTDKPFGDGLEINIDTDSESFEQALEDARGIMEEIIQEMGDDDPDD